MKNNFDYEITCYKDKNGQLGGELYLTESLYNDFDEVEVLIQKIII